jgi:ATP-binding cassette subfamily F protein 2
MAPVNKTALECVMEVDHERIKLEAEAERLAAVSDDDGKIIENSFNRICFCFF